MQRPHCFQHTAACYSSSLMLANTRCRSDCLQSAACRPPARVALLRPATSSQRQHSQQFLFSPRSLALTTTLLYKVKKEGAIRCQCSQLLRSPASQSAASSAIRVKIFCSRPGRNSAVMTSLCCSESFVLFFLQDQTSGPPEGQTVRTT